MNVNGSRLHVSRVSCKDFADSVLLVQGHMAAAFRYWGKLGFGEGAAGHITVRDPVLPDHYWYSLLRLTCPIIFVTSIHQDEPFWSAFLLHKRECLAFSICQSSQKLCYQKSKLVLVGPDGYVTPHGAQLPINTAGYIIRMICIFNMSPCALILCRLQTLQFTKPVQTSSLLLIATLCTAKPGPSLDVRLTSSSKTGASSTII